MRKKLVDLDVVECVIGLGSNLFFNASMEACIVICNTNKPQERKGKILFIDAKSDVTRKNGQSYLEPTHIQKIVSAYKSFVDKDYFAKVVASSEIQTNRSLLSIQSYVAQKSETIAYDLTECLNTWHTDKDNLHKEMSNLINLFTT